MSSLPVITEQDWQQTPPSIQMALNQLVAQVQEHRTNVSATVDQLLRIHYHNLQPRNQNQIVMIAHYVTARQLKYAKELKKLGWEIILLHQEPLRSDDLSSFREVIQCEHYFDVLEKCLLFTPKAYHIYTSWQFELPAYLIGSGLHPILFDDYDLITGCVEKERPNNHPTDKFLALERFCLENADALTLRDGRLSVAKREEGVQSKKVCLSIDGSISEQEAQRIRKPKRTDGIHAVYVGNMIEPDSPRPRNFHFELARKLSNAGIHYHIYPSHPKLYRDYKPLMEEYVRQHCPLGYVHLHEPVPMNQVVPEISQYHFGIDVLTTSINRLADDHPFYNMDNTEYGLDNKLFDYIGAGLFSFAHRAKWCQRILERYQLGVVVESFDDIVAQAKQRYMKPFPAIPEVLTTEYWAKRLSNFYKQEL